MTSFINTPQPTHHHGADRVEALIDAAQQLPRNVSGKRGITLLLGSAFAAAVAAVSYEVMDSADESHLLMIWVILWMALFAALAFFAGTFYAAGLRVRRSLDDWSRSIAEARADQRLWAIARQDERVMGELQAAMARSQALDETGEAPQPQRLGRSRSYSMQRAHKRGDL